MIAEAKYAAGEWDIINLLASGEVPVAVSKHLAGVEKSKASDFFAPYQFGVACAAGAEKQSVNSSVLSDLSMFPPEMKRSSVPHLEILGAPIGDAFFCAKVVSQKCAIASKLLSQLEEIYTTFSHCRRTGVLRHCFALSTAVDTTNSAWKQAQLSLSRGGLGLCRLSEHSSACYIASLSMAGMCSESNRHLLNAINQFNEHVSNEEMVTLEAIREPSEFQAAIQWWLGVGISGSQGATCPHCTAHSLDPLGHQCFDIAVLDKKRSEARFLLKRLEDGGQVNPQMALVLLRLCGGYYKMLDPLGHHATTLETYGAWGKEALEAFSMLASCLATSSSRPKFHQVTIKWWLGPSVHFALAMPLTLLDIIPSLVSVGVIVVARYNILRDVLAESFSVASTKPMTQSARSWAGNAHHSLETYGCWGAEARETLAVETYGCWGAEARETLALETYGCWGAEARETLAVETYGCWGAETLSCLATRLATHEVHQVPGHCCHLWQTQPHFGEVLCKSPAVKSWAFVGRH
eukprot:Em0019g950a